MINAWRIARRELRSGLRGFRVFLACLALGVGAIAAVGSIASSVIGGLEKDGAVLLGGDAALRVTYRDITPDQRAWLDRSADISRVVYLRSMARAADSDRRTLVEMKMVETPIRFTGRLKSLRLPTTPRCSPNATASGVRSRTRRCSGSSGSGWAARCASAKRPIRFAAPSTQSPIACPAPGRCRSARV